ncbi:hypothetical protein DN069_04950 [Streptacidiphilus pinicola]|uniref:HTH arsR-type domain-containing protein n=1 Tax=Streptacidiphilus pinicola TaxID=2219663 RepID=A0A2X0IT21_9ACTN|nr:helix-turn-helix domain-containing protein [Streptacidiphilus pinicola]RAG86743.1 hypothetical protein DN069_04950 [Streptacidiphilus pinicola]
MDGARDLRIVEDVETLKALADPLRIAILQTMSGADRRSWTAKELAAELGEPQTKLYRHLKHLEEAGLILVAETRVVSGILEQRYAVAQRRIQLGADFIAGTVTGSSEGQQATLDVVQAALSSYEQELVKALRSGRIHLDDVDESRRPLLMVADYRMSPDRAESYRRRLRQLADELEAEPHDPDGVPVNVLLTLYRLDE